MRKAWIASALIRRIEAYRRSEVAARHAGTCHFAPSCSHYGEQALRRRALPVALVLIAWRLLRCRPSVPEGTWDPVPRRKPTTAWKVASVLLLSGIVTLGTAGLAQAVTPPTRLTQGGCEATINGTDITSFNRNHPLVVEKGQRVVVEGFAPQEIRNAPEPAGAHFISNVEVTLLAPITVTSEDEEGNGWRRFTSTQNVDRYLRYGSGLYRLTAVAVGSAGGRHWKCQATFYAKLDGNTAAGLIAGVAGAVGLAGAATASGKSDWAVGDVIPPDEQGGNALNTTGDAAADLTNEVSPDPSGNKRLDRTTMSCFAVLIAFMFASDGVRLLEPGEENLSMGGALLGGVGGGATSERRIWRRGHPIRGFLGGLFAGLGLVVFMQQRGYWVLTWANTIAFPLILAAIAGWRGWRGRASIVTTRSAAAGDEG